MDISQDPIPMESVESTQIAAVGHDPETQRLAVQFKTGATYFYGNIDGALFHALRNAQSIGGFFQRNIKPNPTAYPYSRVQEA